jgi:hypothetical protein
VVQQVEDTTSFVPRIKIYWDAFNATQLLDFYLPSHVFALIKLAFYSGAFATITFRRIVLSEVPDNARNVVLQGFCDDVEEGIRYAERQAKSRRPRFSRTKKSKAYSEVTKEGKIKNVNF